ncbi:MAG: ABC transporter permease [Myxococcota bacterium]
MNDTTQYRAIVWAQFRRRRLAMASLGIMLGLVFLAVFAPLLASNKPFLWYTSAEGWSSPWIRSLFDRNFFESGLDLVFNTTLVFAPLFAVVFALGARTRRWRRPAVFTWFGVTILVLVFSGSEPKRVYPVVQSELESAGVEVFALYPPFPYSFRDIDLKAVREPPSLSHWLGTDNAGRDVLTRLVYGTRISLTVGLFAVALYILVGTFLGALAGYYGGWVDLVIQRMIEVMLSIPSLFLILTVAAFIEERSIFHIMLIIAAVQWTTPARLVRGEVLRLRDQDFVVAARASGFSEGTIVFRHILPNAIGPVLVAATFGVAAAILIESTMSFLGLGDITVPSWGQILSTGRTTGMWTLILAPGFAIFLTVSVLNLLGDGLRDALDPKLRS